MSKIVELSHVHKPKKAYENELKDWVNYRNVLIKRINKMLIETAIDDKTMEMLTEVNAAIMAGWHIQKLKEKLKTCIQN